MDERRREGEEIGGREDGKGRGFVYVCGRDRQKEKRQTAGAAAGGRVTAKGSVRQPSDPETQKIERKTEPEVGCFFLLRSFASSYRS